MRYQLRRQAVSICWMQPSRPQAGRRLVLRVVEKQSVRRREIQDLSSATRAWGLRTSLPFISNGEVKRGKSCTVLKSSMPVVGIVWYTDRLLKSSLILELSLINQAFVFSSDNLRSGFNVNDRELPRRACNTFKAGLVETRRSIFQRIYHPIQAFPAFYPWRRFVTLR